MRDALSVREKLLDAAEALFADGGYHGVSVRDITSAAKVRLAAINDHFGSKEQLFAAVIARRAGVINDDRQKLLAALPVKGSRKAMLLKIVEAFALPLLLRSQESEGWQNYMRLVAQLSNTRSRELLLIAEHFNPIALEFIRVIRKAVPELDQKQSLLAYQLMLSSVMTVFSDNLRVNVLSGNAYQSRNFAMYYDDTIRYVVGGILAMASA